MRGIVHRTFKTLASLKAAGIYENLEEISVSLDKKGSNAWLAPYYVSSDSDGDRFQELNDNIDGDIKREGEIEIWEYWGKFDNDEYIITVANGDVVIRFEKNFYDHKFKPFVATPNYNRDIEFYGIPELIAVRSLIKEANALRNARLDVINLSVNPMWIIDKFAGIDISRDTFISRPGKAILASNIDGMRPIQLPDPSLASLTEGNSIQQDIQQASSLVNSTSMLTQLGRSYGRSATGVNFLSNIANNRLGLKARFLKWSFFEPLGQIMFLTNKQFLPNDIRIKSRNPDRPSPFVSVTPDLFDYNYSISVKTDIDTGGVEGQFSKMQMIAQLAQVFENTQPGTIRSEVLLEELLRPLLGSRVGKFVRSPEERSVLQAQNLAMQQAINAQQGAAAPQPNAGTTQLPVAPIETA